MPVPAREIGRPLRGGKAAGDANVFRVDHVRPGFSILLDDQEVARLEVAVHDAARVQLQGQSHEHVDELDRGGSAGVDGIGKLIIGDPSGAGWVAYHTTLFDIIFCYLLAPAAALGLGGVPKVAELFRSLRRRFGV